jgi:hypothetical protein
MSPFRLFRVRVIPMPELSIEIYARDLATAKRIARLVLADIGGEGRFQEAPDDTAGTSLEDLGEVQS